MEAQCKIIVSKKLIKIIPFHTIAVHIFQTYVQTQ